MKHTEGQPKTFEESAATSLRWVKASERLPENKGTYITRRRTLVGKDWMIKDTPFNPKYDDTYIHQWAKFGLEWLDESPAPAAESTSSPQESFETIYETLWKWQQETFDTSAVEAVSGLIKEAEELEKSLKEETDKDALIEAVDCFNYLLYIVRKRGFSLADLKNAHAEKFEILKNHEWKKREDGCYQHVPSSPQEGSSNIHPIFNDILKPFKP